MSLRRTNEEWYFLSINVDKLNLIWTFTFQTYFGIINQNEVKLSDFYVICSCLWVKEVHFCFLLVFTVASLLEVWNKKCKKTLHEINQVIHDKKYILFFHHPINFWVYPCTGKRTKYEYSLWEVSAGDQLSIKLNTYLSAKVESVKDVLSEKWEILEKILSFF